MKKWVIWCWFVWCFVRVDTVWHENSVIQKIKKVRRSKKCPCYADILVYEEKFQEIKEAVRSVCRAYLFPLELKRQKRVKPWKIKQKRNENEKISLKWWNFTKYPAACPLHRRRGEHVREGPERCGHPLCHVLPGRVRWVSVNSFDALYIVVMCSYKMDILYALAQN